MALLVLRLVQGGARLIARILALLRGTLIPALPTPPEPVPPWQRELEDLSRGASGALLFGIPFLYTMEVWWKGLSVDPLRMLFGLGLAYAVQVVLNRFAGFRRQHAVSWSRTLLDAAEALALALLMAAFSLFVLRRLALDSGLEAIVGRIVVLGVPYSLGIGIANNLLGGRGRDAGGNSESWFALQFGPDQSWRGTLIDAGATALGATIVAFSIAPTDEIPLISSAFSPPWLLLLMGVTLLISYMIVFEAEFREQQSRQHHQGVFQSPLGETVFSYLISLVVSLLMLWFFELLHVTDPWSKWLIYTIVLGLPATIGGAAGRLAV